MFSDKFDRDFNLMLKKLTIEEAKSYVLGNLDVTCFYKAFNLIDEHTIDAGVYMYKNGVPFKGCKANIVVNKQKFNQHDFIEGFEGKEILLGQQCKKTEVVSFSKEEDIAALIYYVDSIRIA